MLDALTTKDGGGVVPTTRTDRDLEQQVHIVCPPAPNLVLVEAEDVGEKQLPVARRGKFLGVTSAGHVADERIEDVLRLVHGRHLGVGGNGAA